MTITTDHNRLNTASASEPVRLLGLDFGSTTSSMMLAEVTLSRHSLSGRMTFSEPIIRQRSEPVFTPFNDDRIDETALAALLDGWLSECALSAGQPLASQTLAGAALVTGLAACSHNAARISELVRARLGDSLIASADDPQLESWLAFMGSCATLSRHLGERPLLNLDIGGGTTNPALGRNGEVLHCGCYFIGARHLRFAPGSYRLTGTSEQGRALLHHLQLPTEPGTELSAQSVIAVCDLLVRGLEAIVAGEPASLPVLADLQQVASGPVAPEAVVTFSGGVGELIYQHGASGQWPARTAFGDLGIDLAQAILRSPRLSRDLHIRPENAGRATVMGLTLHSCDVSGSSLYLSDSSRLPLNDIPLIARLAAGASATDWQQATRLAAAAARSQSGQGSACIAISGTGDCDHQQIRALAEEIRAALEASHYPINQPLVLLLDSNTGKTLGQYVTSWGQAPRCLFVIDEIPLRQARFARIGQPHQHIVPVSFFGMNQP